MSGDTRRIRHVELTLKYSGALSEDEAPQPGKPEIVVSPQTYVKARKWHISRVFYFLTLTSALCLATVALVPKPVVQATVLGIWAASVGLAQYLLAGAYRQTDQPDRDQTQA